MWYQKKSSFHTAVVHTPSEYTIVTIAYNPTTDLFILHNYVSIAASHGEFGPHFFINHGLLFKHVINTRSQFSHAVSSLALLFQGSFITQKTEHTIPSLTHEGYTITHPLLLQCALISHIYKIPISLITETSIAHATALARTKHPEDEYSFSDCLLKKIVWITFPRSIITMLLLPVEVIAWSIYEKNKFCVILFCNKTVSP